MFSREGTAGGRAYLPVELGGGVELLPGKYLREAGGMGMLLRAGTEAPRDGEEGDVEVTEIAPPCRGGKTRRRDGIGRNCGVRGVGPRHEGRGGVGRLTHTRGAGGRGGWRLTRETEEKRQTKF
jgi:hypothetical protein